MTDTASGTRLDERLARWVVDGPIGAGQSARIEAAKAARAAGPRSQVTAPAAIGETGPAVVCSHITRARKQRDTEAPIRRPLRFGREESELK